MIVKAIAILAFLLIVSSLGFALFQLVAGKGDENSAKLLKALTTRITLSVILFIFIFIALSVGLFEPQGIGVHLSNSSQTSKSTK